MNLFQRISRRIRAWPGVACLFLLAASPLSAQQPKLSRTLTTGPGPAHVALSPDGKALASAGQNTVELWEVATGKNLATLKGRDGGIVNAVAFSPDGRTVASGWEVPGTTKDRKGGIRLWDVVTGKSTTTLMGHEAGVVSLAFSPDGQALASGSWDGTVKLWDVPAAIQGDK